MLSITHGWKQSDLAWLGQPSSTADDSQLIAAYFRQSGQEYQIRLDLLELTGLIQEEIRVALDSLPGGSRVFPDGSSAQLDWDYLFYIKQGSPPEVYSATSGSITGIIPRMVQDTRLDTIVVAWNQNLIPSTYLNLKFQVTLLQPGLNKIVSQTPVIHPGFDPPNQAPLLLAFWDCLHADSPAQALRRWDGAHTGPLGQRHGLNILTSLTREFNVPITLLDLRLPESLFALEYMQVSQPLRSSLVSGQLQVPESSWGDSSWTRQSQELSSEFSLGLGWQQSPVAYGAFSDPLPGRYSHFFAALPDPTSILDYHGTRLIPLPGLLYGENQDIQYQIDNEGLSKPTKMKLLAAALSSDITDLVVLGGALPQSLWAEASIAPLVFEYISEHPWINPLSTTELLEFPARHSSTWPLPGCEDLLCTTSPDNEPLNTSQGDPIASGYSRQDLLDRLDRRLKDLPDNIYAKSAINSFLMLSDIHPDANLVRLQTNYLSQVSYLAYAAEWADQPRALSTCMWDVDWDGDAECILASDEILVIIELDGGRIVFAGSKNQLWIAPTSLFAVGIGDSGSWRLELGPASDPQAIPGAFADMETPFDPFTAQIEPGDLILSKIASDEVRSFSIKARTLRVGVSGTPDYQTRIPLVLNDSTFLDWQENRSITCAQNICAASYPAGILEVTFEDAVVSAISSMDSYPFMLSAEVPDRAYPAGHYLPFPLAVLNLHANPESRTITVTFGLR